MWLLLILKGTFLHIYLLLPWIILWLLWLLIVSTIRSIILDLCLLLRFEWFFCLFRLIDRLLLSLWLLRDFEVALLLIFLVLLYHTVYKVIEDIAGIVFSLFIVRFSIIYRTDSLTPLLFLLLILIVLNVRWLILII